MAAAGQFPLFRLATLLARQLSAPVATKIKKFAVEHPRFRHSVCVRTGRVYHTWQMRARLWVLALRQPRTLPPISEQAALDSGANILGEAVVFGLGGLIIIFEVNRQANIKDDKVLEEASRWLALHASLEELRRELRLQQQDIDRLHAALRRLSGATPTPPFVPTVPPPPPTSASPTSLTSKCSQSSTIDCLPPSTTDCLQPSTSDCPQPSTTD